MATLFECPQYLEQTSGRASGDFLVALQPLVSYFPIQWRQSHSKSVLWRHVCKTGRFVQLLLRLFCGSKRVYEYKGSEHGWEFQERGLWGNLGSIPGIEPRSKRDIWEGESVLSLFITMATVRHKAVISGQARQFGVVSIKTTWVGLVSQLHQPILRKGSGDQFQLRQEHRWLEPMEGYKLGLVAFSNYLFHCIAQVNPVTWVSVVRILWLRP